MPRGIAPGLQEVLRHPLDGPEELERAQAEPGLVVARVGREPFAEGFLAVLEPAFDQELLDEGRAVGPGLHARHRRQRREDRDHDPHDSLLLVRGAGPGAYPSPPTRVSILGSSGSIPARRSALRCPAQCPPVRQRLDRVPRRQHAERKPRAPEPVDDLPKRVGGVPRDAVEDRRDAIAEADQRHAAGRRRADHHVPALQRQERADDDGGVERRELGPDQDDPARPVGELPREEGPHPPGKILAILRLQRPCGGDAGIEPGPGVPRRERQHATTSGGKRLLRGPKVGHVERHRLGSPRREILAKLGSHLRVREPKRGAFREEAQHGVIGQRPGHERSKK